MGEGEEGERVAVGQDEGKGEEKEVAEDWEKGVGGMEMGWGLEVAQVAQGLEEPVQVAKEGRKGGMVARGVAEEGEKEAAHQCDRHSERRDGFFEERHQLRNIAVGTTCCRTRTRRGG